MDIEKKVKEPSTEYSAIHMWLYTQVGKADHCSFDSSHQSPRFQWANVSREYERDVNDFIPLCPSCHKKYDFTEKMRLRLRDINLGNVNASVPVIQKKDGRVVGMYKSAREAWRNTGISYTAISNTLTGRSRTAGGFEWTI